MIESIKQFPKRFLEWWNKFTVKQRFIIMGAVAAVLTGLIVLVLVLNKPKYVELITCDSTKQASEVTALLTDASLTYRVDENALKIEVLKGQLSDARLLLGENGIPSTSYTLAEALSGGLSTTESDKEKRYQLYMQSELEEDLERFEFVKTATVNINVPRDDGTLISTGAETSATVILTLKSEMTLDMAQGVARAVQTALGNATTDNITIMDTEGKTYFIGGEDTSAIGTANNQLTTKQQMENTMTAQVRNVLNGTGEFSSISVAPNLDVDFSTTDLTWHNYGAPDGMSQGYYSSERQYTSSSTSGGGGVPGTTSNDETVTYDINVDGTTSEEMEEYDRQYVLDEEIGTQTVPPGVIKYDTSSLAISAVKYNIIREEDARDQGLLDGISWSEYKNQNSERTKLEIDEDWVAMAASATGIPAGNITFVLYSENMFIDAEGSSIHASDVLTVLLIIIILALLAFVVLRSMRGEKRTDEEEELSVESLLQSTPVEELEDIEVEEKSEVRRLIDKFVDDNPEAAANLLRNWLNEDWG
ncbi:MAG: flagellar M-ring protein FliF [Lachnospiraceae bacterium]|nr:flagellar M-ring protein FliF [Lachnospiraceae bacterium]